MKTKYLFLLLTLSLTLSACGGPVEDPEEATFEVYEIVDCRSYFDYLSLDVETSAERGDGLVTDISCDGTVEYREGELFDLLLNFDYLDQPASLSIDADPEEVELQELIDLNGQSVVLTGDLQVQVLGQGGAILYVEDYVVE